MGKGKPKGRKGAAADAEAKPAAEQNAKRLANDSSADHGPSQAPSKDRAAWRSREKPLVLCARGITYRYRHLMTDLMQLLPHHKTDSKLDTKHDWNAINEVAELKVCTCVDGLCGGCTSVQVDAVRDVACTTRLAVSCHTRCPAA